jgi:hypothetical protein
MVFPLILVLAIVLAFVSGYRIDKDIETTGRTLWALLALPGSLLLVLVALYNIVGT